MKNPEIAKRIKEAMEYAGVTQQELSNKSGIGKSSISQYVHGTYIPNNATAQKLGDALGVSPVWLMGFDVPMFSFTVKDRWLLTEEEKKEKLEMIQKLNDSPVRRLVAYWAAFADIEQVEAVANMIKAMGAKED